jgi:thiamine-phosphate pyrophosphorylase
VLLDGRATTEEFRLLAGKLASSGADVIQLRDKRLDDRALVERARCLRVLTQGGNTLFVVNDRADLALLARADGVHLGQEDLSVKDARAVVGPRMLIGVSVHSLEQARAAVLDGADYLGVGPTFSSSTKAFDHYPGPELLRAVAAEISLPTFAIGGIDRDNLPRVLATGMRRVAVGSAVVDADNPAVVAANLKAMLRG